jgi:hypothetical protein
MKKKLVILGEYIGHLAIGAAMFSALLLIGGALSIFVHWMTPIIADDYFTQLMKWVERIILYADVAFILWWALFSTLNAIKEMNDAGFH